MTRWLTRLARITLAPWQVLALAASLAISCGDGPFIPSPTAGQGADVDPLPPVSAGLPPLTVVGTEFYAGGEEFTWAGVTSFDVGARVAQGDERWIDWAADEGFTILRVVPATAYRTPRTIQDGIAQLRPVLIAAERRGLYVEVVIGVDTIPLGLSRDAYQDYVGRISGIVNGHTNAVVELANEIGHITQADYLTDVHLQRYVLGLFDAPVSAGSTHGGQAPRWDAGDYLTHHADRRRTPEQNGQIMAAAQSRARKPVVDDEAIGISAFARPGSRTDDVTYGARQARAYHHYGLGGVTLHLEAGLDASVDQLDAVQREAARRFVAAMKR